MEAARQGHLPLARRLLALGVRPDFHTAGDAYPRPAAVEVVDCLLARGADPDRRTRFGNAVTVVSCAPAASDREAENAVLETARHLLETGADANASLGYLLGGH